MSRELKFRAWDKVEKRYRRIARLNFYDGELVSITVYDPDDFAPTILSLERVILEQSTGIKDKYGKEIYEGDIVRTTNRVTAKSLIFPVGVVEFKQQAFWICNVPSERPNFTHNETLLQYWETDLEVIGNVHENPKLLGGGE